MAPTAQQPDISAIVFSGGINHPFEEAASVLGAILEHTGFDVRVSFDLEEVLAALRTDRAALLVNYALRWSMTQDEKYAPDRAGWALQLSSAARETITRHVNEGAGLLGLHTASICFDDWPEWGDVLGGAWHWGKSWHPLPAPAQVRVDPQHELTRGLGDFSLRDEVYADLDLVPGIEIAAWAEAGASNDKPPTGAQPALWTHRYGRGRVVYDALGHDAESLEHPVHRQILQRAALWACGRAGNVAEDRSCAK